MEASVRNCVEKKMLCCVNGSFGKRFAEVAASNGKDVEKLEVPLGQPITPNQLDQELSRNPGIESVAITHNETSTGLLNPLEELAKVVKDHGKLLFVDAVSSMGGTKIEVDKWGLDVCFGSSQKCFGVPPGLGIGSVSQEALERSETAKNKGWYFDFKLWERYQRDREGTPMTSVIPQIAGLNKILKLIEAWGGKEAYFQLYKERNRKIREGVRDLELTLLPKEGYESPTVSCVNAPSGRSGVEVYEQMRKEGFELAKGYGTLKASTFRIGNMGYVEFEDIELMLKKLRAVISNLAEM